VSKVATAILAQLAQELPQLESVKFRGQSPVIKPDSELVS
jgi:hypothetical protein